jgi:hypothetical protein
MQMENNEMSPGQWALTLFLTNLPMIGIVLLIVWAVGNDDNVTRRNFAKGALILYAIIISLAIMFFIFGGLAILGLSY